MRPLYASVDPGCTNVTAAIADAEGRVLAEDKQPTQSHGGPTGTRRRSRGHHASGSPRG
jgi:predicted NBD/HSP70 family sugar kinase